jgi:hypothetical protein
MPSTLTWRWCSKCVTVTKSDLDAFQQRQVTMNPLTDNDTARQDARDWSGRLGHLAAELPAPSHAGILPQFQTASPAAFPTRLSLILDHLRQGRQRQEHAADQLRAQEFLSGM